MAAQTAVYVYGIIPADTEIESGTTGVGDPPGQVRLVRHGDLAALVSDVDVSKPLGRPEDLMAHEELLDGAAGDVPVLPLRFGAVVSDDKGVTSELLEDHHDEFTDALGQLEGCSQYVIKGRYDETKALGDVLSNNEEASSLREQIADLDENATRDQRMRLGEIISNAVEQSRERDTQVLLDAVADCVEDTVVREPTHELDAVHAALLVKTDRVPDLERALDGLAGEWGSLIELRLLGPQAAYDFVGTTQPQPSGG